LADPYTTLGVPRDASQDAIRDAYRKLAKQHHPDLNPGNAKAEETFKAVSAANSILSDPEKRGKFEARSTHLGKSRLRGVRTATTRKVGLVVDTAEPAPNQGDGATPTSATSSTRCSARGDKRTTVAQVMVRTSITPCRQTFSTP
jgi:curved DNA-binding protein CbpA